MKYQNAQDLLPEELLREVQKYISGKLVYIPAQEQRREWGSVSGYRQFLAERNQQIRARFAIGETISQLADNCHLSCESIKRIVYSQKEVLKMEYRRTLSSAAEWAQMGKLEEWVHTFLLSDGHNKPFSDGLYLEPRIFMGPLRMPMHLMHRCCGPEESLPFHVPQDAWDRHVAKLTQAILSDPDMPPLIVHYTCENGKDDFTVNDGNTRFEAYTRLGREEVNVILWITDMPQRQDDYGCFRSRYPEYCKER